MQLINQQTTQPTEKSITFQSPSGASGTFWYCGYHTFAASDNDFDPSVTFGSANLAYGAHFLVVLGAETVDELTIRVTGTSINDAGVRAAGAIEDMVIASGTAVNAYFETEKKWIGQITISVQSGTPKTCNYGFAKYWDNNNTDFKITGIDVVWLGGAADSNPDILLHHHKATGWTFGSGAEPSPPTALASMATDYNTEIQVGNGVEGAWKRDNLSQLILGGNGEGMILQIITTANKAFDLGTALIRVEAA